MCPSKTILSPEASRAFAEALLKPAAPNAALLRAARRYSFRSGRAPAQPRSQG